ncbi:uncharacterized protein FOMMEDRAFT_30462 [Fomitiporia mediterranea MF3/22]|uniref:uncharacterized protein n=1 Tax=Fomitiporia mediterranea (strain MF3/22) TaxID=694068 RepID=UPI0004409093|nr:uncharacterized protein FOMMEDRAFT_30462 [Fomitiporia mediterranea MF3/22]EJD00411.1 hypothetical protein FOMMEDRAFT_30462 [Fomitiporia mediterranea MF3/22]
MFGWIRDVLRNIFIPKSKITHVFSSEKTLLLSQSRKAYVLLPEDEEVAAIKVLQEAGHNEKEFTIFIYRLTVNAPFPGMRKNLPHMKWIVKKSVVGDTANLIVYENTEDPKKWITYLWKCFCDDRWDELEDAYKFAFGVMRAFAQPTDQPLTCKDNTAELMFYARKEGYEVRWIMSMHKTPYLNQIIMTGPDGYNFETEVTCWYPTCWKQTKAELERICEKDFGFTFDKINKEIAEKIAEELKRSLVLNHNH